MNSWPSTVAWWIADYYLLVTALILLTWAAMRFVRQPAHRLMLAWVTMAGLAVLAGICVLPMWPRVQVVSLLPDEPLPEASASSDVETPTTRPTRPREDMPDLTMPSPASAWEYPYEEAKPIESVPAEIEPVPAEIDPVSGVEAESSWSFAQVATILGSVFVAGATTVGLWLAWGAVQIALLCRGASKAPEPIQAELRRIVGADGRVPRLLLSPNFNSAIVLGILRPTIVLPSAVVEEGARAGMKAALAHEWAHIKNGDLWLLAASRFMLLLLFAHPFFWCLRRRIRVDQETVADATAAGDTSRLAYAEELIAWARTGLGLAGRRIPAALAIQQGPSQLETRVAMLLDESVQIETSSSRRWKYTSLATAGLVVLSLSVLTLHPTSSAVADSASSDDADEKTGSSTISDEEEAVAVLEQLGASFVRCKHGRVTTVNFRESQVKVEDLVHLKRLPMLRWVIFHKTDVVDIDLAHLKGLSTLATLSLDGSQFTNAALAHLRELPQLRRLMLYGAQINDENMALLQELIDIDSVVLSNTRVTEAGLASLTKLPNLYWLVLSNSDLARSDPDHPQFTDACTEYLERIPTLTRLSFHVGTGITDTGLERLKKLDKLESLVLNDRFITDAGFGHIGEMKNLRRLWLSPYPSFFPESSPVTDSGIKHLEGLTKLEELYVQNAQVTNAGMASLEDMTALKTLTLGRTEVTDSGLAHLRKLVNLESLFLDRTQLTDAGLPHLVGLTKLKSLRLDASGVTETGLNKLQQALPNCEIQSDRSRAARMAELHVDAPRPGVSVPVGGLELVDLQFQVSGPGSSERLSGASVTDETLALLKDRTNLRYLFLRDTSVTDEGLAHLQGMTQLRSLDLSGSVVTGAGLTHLQGLTELMMLTLDRTAITDEGLRHLGAISGLRHLTLRDNSQITDAGLVHLAGLPNLDTLSLGGNVITGAGLAHVKDLPRLRSVILQNMQITEDELDHLRGLTELTFLMLPGTPITDEGLQHLSGLSKLRILNLPDSKQITDAGLAHLQGLINLTNLDLNGTRITDAGLVHLTGLSNLDSLNLRETGVTDASLTHLEKLTTLKRLSLDRTQVTENGIKTLWRTLPNATITPLPLRPSPELFKTTPGDEDTLAALRQRGITMILDEAGKTVGVKFFGHRVEDADLAYLDGLDQIEVLEFTICRNITDAGLEMLVGLSNLRKLDLTHCERLTDTGLEHLQGLTALTELDLSYSSGLTDAGLEHLKGLTGLQHVFLNSTQVTDAGVKKLRQALPGATIHHSRTSRLPSPPRPGSQEAGPGQPVPSLALRSGRVETDAQMVDLPDTVTNLTLWRDVTKAGFQELRRMPNLERLSIFSKDIGDEDLQVLAGHKNLQVLNLASPNFTDGCFEQLKALPSLSELWFHQAQITDAGLLHLRTLPGIRKLTFGHAHITDAGLDVLKELKDLKTIRFSDVPISDAGLEKVCQISGLEELSLTQTNITNEGLGHLSQLTSLRDLMLQQEGLTNVGMEHVGKVTSLDHLGILKGNVTDKGLLHLKDLNKLGFLSLLNLPVSQEGVDELQKALPNARIHVMDSQLKKALTDTNISP